MIPTLFITLAVVTGLVLRILHLTSVNHQLQDKIVQLMVSRANFMRKYDIDDDENDIEFI